MVKINKLSSFFSEKMKKTYINTYNQKSILHNSILLYIILFISLAQLLYYVVEGRYFFIIVFIFIGYLTHFFSKNMMVIMCISIVFTYILSSSMDDIEEVHEPMTNSGVNNTLNEKNTLDTTSNKDSTFSSTTITTEPNDNTNTISEEEIKELKGILEKMNVESTPTPTQSENIDVNSKSIEEINAQTRELIKTQKQLLQNMNTLSPLLSQAENFLGNFSQ
jgi:hypothetical protein